MGSEMCIRDSMNSLIEHGFDVRIVSVSTDGLGGMAGSENYPRFT